MLNENFVSTILQASITGAGLILAIYGIISPLASRIAKNRLQKFTESWKNFEEILNSLKSTDTKSEDFENAKAQLEEIEKIKSLPPYLSWMIFASFLGYLFTALLSVWFFMEYNFFDYPKEKYVMFIAWLFIISSAIFGYIGFKSIKDIAEIISTEFKIIKLEVKRQKEVVRPLTNEDKKILISIYEKSRGTSLLMSPESIFNKRKLTIKDEKILENLILKGLINVNPHLTQKEKYSISQQGINLVTILRSKK